MCLVIQIKHILRVYAISHHFVCGGTNLLAEIMRGSKVILVIDCCAIIALAFSFDSHRVK